MLSVQAAAVPSSAASAADTSRCTEDVDVNGDNVDADYKTQHHSAAQRRHFPVRYPRASEECARDRPRTSRTPAGRSTATCASTWRSAAACAPNQAVVEFRNNQIAKATITGQPAEFEQKRKRHRTTWRAATRGEIVYEVAPGTVRLANDAWLTHGGND